MFEREGVLRCSTLRYALARKAKGGWMLRSVLIVSRDGLCIVAIIAVDFLPLFLALAQKGRGSMYPAISWRTSQSRRAHASPWR